MQGAPGEELKLALYLRTPWVGRDRLDLEGKRLPSRLHKIVHVETQSRFTEDIFERLKGIIKGAQFFNKLNSKPALVRPSDINGPSNPIVDY